jgi:hypothetical protein
MKPSATGYEGRLLDAIADIESGGNPNAVNKKTGAAGMYGIMPANAKTFGIDPTDPVASRAVAQRIYEQFYGKYHDTSKALAAYNGDTHIDADSKKYDGDWLKGAKQETIDYLKKMELRGMDVGLTPSQQAFVDAHTSVKGSGKGGGLDADPSIVPYDGGNPDADKNYVTNQMQQHNSGMDDFAKYFREGGGAQFAGNQQQSNGNGGIPGQAAPYLVQVQVTPAAGHNTAVTMGGLPQ